MDRKFRRCSGLVTLLVAACNGSDGPADSFSGVDDGQPAALAFGTVSSFGSVIVNGVRYETAGAQFRIDDTVGTQSELDVGDVVLVEGQLRTGGVTGTAATVTFDENVEGPIGSLGRDSLVVLGQTVLVDAYTSFDTSIAGASLAGLDVGDVVEVSGHVAAGGAISATRLAAKAAGGELAVTGLVSQHDAAGRRFNVNGQVVDYSAAMLISFPAGMIADGQIVEAKGTTISAAGALNATRVELEVRAVDPERDDHVEVEGLVTRFASATDFAVAGVAVVANPQTVFVGGRGSDVGLDDRMEVEGTVNAANALVAERVVFRPPARVRIAGRVDSVSASDGVLVVLDVRVRTDALTRVEDQSLARLRPFAVPDLATGDFVEIRGSPDLTSAGQVLADVLERKTLDDETVLQGFVLTVAEPAFSILGVTVHTDAQTGFAAADGTPIGATQFFSQLATGRLVKVTGFEIASKAVRAAAVELGN
jgi:uncharacterized protein DUF5666